MRPPNVGILAMEVYMPKFTVSAADLEQHDGVPGKYTKGLGQVSLSYSTEREDTVSMALTAVQRMLDAYAIGPDRIGRLEVGSESGPDRSKSIKSYLMKLLSVGGNFDVEGVDSVHGCYGATAALFNAVNWVESSSWDGRLALVVAADASVYEPGSAARATGGAGAVAMLVGPNAPLLVDAAWRATFADDVEDFCKPVGHGPFPAFNAPATVHQYMRAVDGAYLNLRRRLKRLHEGLATLQSHGLQYPHLANCYDSSQGLLPHVNFCLLHSPFSRIVEKAFSRLMLQDGLHSEQGLAKLRAAGVPEHWLHQKPEELVGAGYQDKDLERALLGASRSDYEQKVQPGVPAQQRVGNTYAASLYFGLAGLWEAKGSELCGKRVMLFSFGSGIVSSMFSLVGSHTDSEFTLERVARTMSMASLLDRQVKTQPEDYDRALKQCQQRWGAVPFQPSTPADVAVNPGTWYLSEVRDSHGREYARA